MKILVFFIWFLGFAIGLPALLLFFLKQGSGPTYLADPGLSAIDNGRFADPGALFGAAAASIVDARAFFPDSDAAAAAVYPDGSRVMVLRALDPARAESMVRDWYTTYRSGNTTADGGGTRFPISTGEIAWHVDLGDVGLLVIGPDRKTMEARRATLPVLRENPQRGLGDKIEREYLPHALAVLLVWVLLVAYQFGRVASWAGGTEPAADVTPVAGAVLETRLMALNRLDAPYTVKPGRVPGEYLVEWRIVDAKWLTLMRAGGRRKLQRLILRLDDEAKKVRAMDQESDLNWSAGVTDANLSWSTSYGITFVQIESERSFGLTFVNGEAKPALSYSYSFNLNELKQPIIGLITGNGWSYRPVITFWRPLGG